ncbi:MAG: hypothetical protein IBX71_00040 [Candidatus Desulforudis sp.]|nr:hypothetical protein [Desulforudis sp.]
MGKEDLEKLIEKAETRELKDQRFWPGPPQKSGDLLGKCKTPLKVIYIILTNCVTINNGACPDWDFCDPLCGKK